jgi:hypothetical protein
MADRLIDEKMIQVALSKIAPSINAAYRSGKSGKGHIRLLLNQALTTVGIDLDPDLVASIATVTTHVMFSDNALARGELESIDENSLKKIIQRIGHMTIGHIFLAEFQLRKGRIDSWEIHGRGHLIVHPKKEGLQS